MEKCTDFSLYESLKYCKGKTILPGVRAHAYVIPKSWIVKWPTLPAFSAEKDLFGKLATYKGDFTLAADKKWLVVDLAYNKGNIEWEAQGNKPSRTFLNKFTATHPEINGSAAAFQRMAIADDLVWAIPQRDGRVRILGSEQFETDTKPSGATGEGLDGSAGSMFAVEATDVCPAPFYEGKIVTAEGEIDGRTDGPVGAAPSVGG